MRVHIGPRVLHLWIVPKMFRVKSSPRTAAEPSKIGHSLTRHSSQDVQKGWRRPWLPVAGSGTGAYLALLEEHTGDNLIEQADQAEHGVIRQVLLCKFALRMPTSYWDPVLFYSL